MPTYEVLPRFWNDFAGLTAAQQDLALAACAEFRVILKVWEGTNRRQSPKFPRRLGVTRMVGHPNVLELAWAPDGRCTWHYGRPQRPGMVHVVWRRVGSHDIYQDP
ncbi:MAG: hypothetical protein ACR2PL_19985 [Dehalococcoidia bacterium]